MSEKKLDCAIVRDLLPLYHDEVVSEVTKTAVAEHLSECADCGIEYLKLRTELPEETAVTPKKKFMHFMRNQKRMRMLSSVLSVILVFGLLVGGYFLQLQFPVFEVPAEEYRAERIYRYETEEEYRYFIIVRVPHYDYMRMDTVCMEDSTLSVRILKPLFSRKSELMTHEAIWVIPGGYEMEGDTIVKRVYDRVVCGETVWEAGMNDEVPEYVYEYDWMHEHGGGCTLDVENNLIAFDCADGVFRWWDLDGNELERIPETIE